MKKKNGKEEETRCKKENKKPGARWDKKTIKVLKLLQLWWGSNIVMKNVIPKVRFKNTSSIPLTRIPPEYVDLQP